MKVIIDKTINISENILKKVSLNSFWDGLKNDLLKENTDDIWVDFVKKNYSSLILDDNYNLISYGSFGNIGHLADNFIKTCFFGKNNTFLGIYLFTVKEFQNRGYAKQLKNEQINFIKRNFPNIKYLIGSTDKKENFELYKTYGVKMIDNIDKTNIVLKQEGIIDKDVFYYYKIY